MAGPKKSKAEDSAERFEEAKARQGTFLAAYEEFGTINSACRVAGVPRGTYNRWYSTDEDFVRDKEMSRRVFAESLEDLALNRVRNPEKGIGGDVLLTVLLNANDPEKYRGVQLQGESSARELILELRKAAKLEKKVINASYRDAVPAEDVEIPVSAENALAEIMEKRSNGKGKETDDSKDEAEE